MSADALWFDLSGGVSGDMLLGACLDAGVPLDVVQGAIDRLGLPEPVHVRSSPVLRSAIGATHAIVETPPESRHDRRLRDILALLERLDEPVRARAGAAFRALAEAEARVHRLAVDDVHFHEVGALDSIADVVGVTAAMAHLAPAHTIASPIALGGGRINSAHGSIPVPGPAVTELLTTHRLPAFGGPVDFELATPTGVALIAVLADAFGPMPAMVPNVVGTGAGTRDIEGHPNVVRLLGGASSTSLSSARNRVHEIATVQDAVVLEANVDDLDPRLWPGVLSTLMTAGASDAWLTPISMKKGRPAHMVSVLCSPDLTGTLARVVLTHTTTIGLRRHRIDKLVLDRDIKVVEVFGEPVAVKVAYLGGEVVNISVEHDHVARVAKTRGCPERHVLDEASRIVAERWPTKLASPT